MKKPGKTWYVAGTLAGVLLFAVLVGTGYQVSYLYQLQRQMRRTERRLPAETESLPVEGSAHKEEGYFVKVLEGYVAVYYIDGKTIYELTEIRADGLPEHLQQRLQQGLKISTTEELYGFLENYSS